MKSELLLVLALSLCVSSKPLSESKTYNKLLLISFDGFRWDYDQDVDTPNLDKLVKEGVKAKYINPPAITMTSPSHFTTITGRWIEDHGVVHNLMFNVTTGLRLTHKATLKKSEWWDNGALPLWITAQNQGLKTASFFYPGGGAKYSGQAVDRSLVDDHGQPDDNETDWRQNIDTVMGWFAKENFDFVTLYYGEPDNVGHTDGPETQARKKIIEQIDRTIGYLREAIDNAGLTDHLNVILTSDHGMTTIKKATEVNEIKLSNYMSFLNLSRFDLLDYGGFGMITPKEGKEQEVYNALKNMHPNLTVYKQEEIPENFHIGKHERIQPIVLLADLGFNINSRIILDINKGDHGFSNEEMDMKMIFRAFGPDFKNDFLAEPFDSVSIYPLMCKILGVVPEANNGSLSDTKGMLVDNFDVGGSSGKIQVSFTLLILMIVILTFI
ncbi:ectonucleotide pyrophosphatase/phosphodiesterase family member 7 [Pimephales promelas]|uniref:ectonucleotide pyrophosphatase/phosphodiesterase family member 7 n=1 Tax=Pimephales promelas TaxID=90988 RepID=UPI001955943D|nr:ectonucleotide pyrophosphatase/phosphodiesterase family member 7 [Pimephales promelas]KAG1964393.1 bis(5'-adenosyl)-triphosphatase ENPP4 [Pimephales promelas]